MVYKSVLLTLLSLHLRDAAAFGSIPINGIPCAAECIAGVCDSPADVAKPECAACLVCQQSNAPSGCAATGLEFIAACDIGVGTYNTDNARYCSGECNAALTSASTGCDANDAVEANIKTTADDFLKFCSL